MSRRVLVAVGAGGVGKTTTAAALGVAAARRGKRVLCLTIDPAQRLAEASASSTMSRGGADRRPRRSSRARACPSRLADGDDARHEAHVRRARRQVLVVARARRSGSSTTTPLPVRLHVARRHAGVHGDGEARRRARAIRASTSSSSTRRRPPTRSTSSTRPSGSSKRSTRAAMRWFVQAFESTGKLSLNLLARSAAVGPARHRQASPAADSSRRWPSSSRSSTICSAASSSARRWSRRRSDRPDVAFVLVTQPAPMSIQEVLFFSERLERGEHAARRVRREPLPSPTAARPTSHRRRSTHAEAIARARPARSTTRPRQRFVQRPRRRGPLRGARRGARASARASVRRERADRPRPRAPGGRARPREPRRSSPRCSCAGGGMTRRERSRFDRLLASPRRRRAL